MFRFLGAVSVITTIVFIILKLTAVIAWSWWLVFLPVLAVAGLWLAWLIVVFLIIGGILVLIDKYA